MPAAPLTQAPYINRRRVGDLVVTMLSDGYLDVSFELLQGIDVSDAEQVLAEHNTSKLPRINVNVYVVQTADRTILIDSGAGGVNGWGGRLPFALAAAGIDPLEIDTILVTHGHPDHIGGLAGPLASPMFQNVQELYVHQDELAFWRNETIRAGAPDGFRPFFDLAQTAFKAYDNRIVTFSGEDIVPGITAVALPGHTPGHTGYLIGDKGDSLLVWGDIVHFPHIQVTRPDVTIAFDSDAATACQTRTALLDRASVDGLAVSGMHFNLPTAGRVERSGSSYQLIYEPWSPALI